LVAGSTESLAGDEGDVWDSGRVESDQSHLVPYAGRPLRSNQTLWWKVRLWNKADEEAVRWSEPARWVMGLLSPEEWQAPMTSPPPCGFGGSLP
jgi:alpha-L-rhamnosidase